VVLPAVFGLEALAEPVAPAADGEFDFDSAEAELTR
jgi:hypothetical protein